MRISVSTARAKIEDSLDGSGRVPVAWRSEMKIINYKL
jgi:hypothetical protein